VSDTYVLVHGAWHTGHEMEAVARHIREAGHQGNESGLTR
jgi:hypothetical protein